MRVFDPAVLRVLVTRVWRFAYRLTEDAPLAEAMVANACDAGLKPKIEVTERQTFVRMLAAAHTVFSGGTADDGPEYSRCATLGGAWSGRSRRSRAAGIHSRILFEFRLLAPPERALLLLAEVEGLTYEESAEVLGVSVDHAKRAHAAVRLKLGSAFSDHVKRKPVSR